MTCNILQLVPAAGWSRSWKRTCFVGSWVGHCLARCAYGPHGEGEKIITYIYIYVFLIVTIPSPYTEDWVEVVAFALQKSPALDLWVFPCPSNSVLSNAGICGHLPQGPLHHIGWAWCTYPSGRATSKQRTTAQVQTTAVLWTGL